MKAQDAPTATAINTAAEGICNSLARLRAIGATTIAAAALFTTLDNSVVLTSTITRTETTDRFSPNTSIWAAIKLAPPVVSIAWPTGIIAASKTTTDQSIAL